MTIRLIAKAVLAAVATMAAYMLPAAPQSPRRIEVAAKRFAFAPQEIALKKGEPVVLVFRSQDVAHGIKFSELGLQTEIPKGGEAELIFTPDKTGEFVGHCSRFCGAGHGSMMMTLHVEE